MPTLLWSVLMEQLLKAIKNEKISSGVLVLLIVVAWGAYAWAEDRYVKQSEFSELQTSVREGFESIEINDASQAIRDIKLEVLITKVTSGSSAEVTRLSDELTHAVDYKKCLVGRGPNCQHLREVE